MQELADENRKLKDEADDFRRDLHQERARTKTMRMIIAKLSLKPEQAKAEIAAVSGVTPLPDRR